MYDATMSRIWKWQEEDAAPLWVEAKTEVAAGRIIAVPTETFYALAVDPWQEAALARLFQAKERPTEKPLLLLVANPDMLSQVAEKVLPLGRRLMERWWPGPLTMIVPARAGLPGLVTGGSRTVAVRQPRQAVTLRLLEALGTPLTGTSANRSGRLPLTKATQVQKEFGQGVSLIVDAGVCPGGLPSTIVDITCSPPRLVRPGAVDTAALLAVAPELQV
jgi:L-threonylcarbamoyladenylate synthase